MEWYGLHLKKSSLKKGVLKETPLHSLAFFLGAPQAWRPRICTDRYAEIFSNTLAECPNLSAEQTVVHGCYLMNPASEREDVILKSGPMFINELTICDKMGVGKYVFHPGCSRKTQEGLQAVVDFIKAGLRETKNVKILVENMTQTNRLCQTWEECRWVLDHINDKRVGFCMDTAHCWGAGEKKGMFMDTLIDDFDRVIGIEHLGAIHLNDSKAEYGANLDLHEDILVGKIPNTFWNKFIFDKRVRRIPAILETPHNCMNTIKSIIDNGPVINNVRGDFVTVNVVKPPNHITDYLNPLNEIDFNRLEDMIPDDWRSVLSSEFEKSYFNTLKRKLLEEKKEGHVIYPQKIFRSLEFGTDIKVVLLAQDPYIRKGQADGLSFSVPKKQKIPPSLRRIYEELKTDIQGFTPPYHGDLVRWAEQKVLLLNATLTVREGKSNSHAKFGWQEFTDAILRWINNNLDNVVFILMGKFAQKKCKFINTTKHYVIKTTHPSPLAGNSFFGSKPFSRCNEYLASKGLKPIIW